MKIHSKLILLFSLMSLIPIVLISLICIHSFQREIKDVIGKRLGTIARGEAGAISLLIKERVKEATCLADASEVKDAVREANVSYINRGEDEIKKTLIQIDKEWIDSQGTTKTANQILNNNLSVFLKIHRSKYHAEYVNILVTDREGAVVAMTKTPTDYYQSDEEWWRNAFNQGRGSVFIDDSDCDISVSTQALGVSVPIKEEGDIIGILKISYRVKDILDLVVNIKTEEDAVASLVRRQGDIIACSSEELTSEQITDVERNILAENEYGWVDDIHGNQRTIMGYAVVVADIYTRVSSPGSGKGVAGEKWEPTKWYLFLDKKQSEVFAPINRLINIIIATTIIIILIVLVIALRISRSFSRPFRLLQEGVNIIGRGNLDYKVALNTNDEIGQLSIAFDQMTEDLKKTTVSRDYVDNIIKSMTDTLVIVAPDTIIQSSNQALCNLLGYREEELTGKPISIILDENIIFIKTTNGEVIISESTTSIESVYLSKDGRKIPVLFSKSIMRDSEKKHIGIICMAVDITERKQAGEARRKIEKKYISIIKDIFTFIPEGILVFTQKFELFRKNKAFHDLITSSSKRLNYTEEELANQIYDQVKYKVMNKDTTEIMLVGKGASEAEKLVLALNATRMSIAEEEEEEETNIVVSLQDITGRKRAEENLKTSYNELKATQKASLNIMEDLSRRQSELAAALKEKEVLLMEIHHRVKNNMQVVSSLIKFQSENIKEKQYVEMFNECRNRIQVMSLIHEKLYSSKDTASINFKDYIEDVANNLLRFYKISSAKIKLVLDVEDISFNIETSIPCGLIINEFICNSLKYAFPDNREGEIKISLHKIEKPKVELVLSDNGICIPDEIDFRNSKSLGLRLITNLSERQLDGKIELDRCHGTEFRIIFEELKYKDRIKYT